MSSNSTTTSNREHETRVPEATAVLIICPAIAALFVAMRIYTRVILVKKYFLEDYSIVAALACAMISSVFQGIAVINGAGRHIEFVTKPELTRLMKAGIGTIQFYFLAHFCLKSSILLQYVRISVMSFERRLCYTLIVINSCGYLALTIVHLSRCRPFKANWSPNLPGAHCLNSTAAFLSAQIWNMLMDFIILLAPLFILRHMTISSWRQRALFSIVLAFGGIACIISAVRLKTLYLSTTSTDPTWDKTPSGFYAQIELNLGIACASVVTLRPLFRRLRQLFSGNKSQHAELEGQQQRCRRQVISPNKTPMSIDFTQVTDDSHSRDVELGGMNKDCSRAGSSVTAVEREEGAEPRISGESRRSK